MKTGMRLDEYTKNLLEKRQKEKREADPIHEQGDTFTSPTGTTAFEEIRLLNEYVEQVNLQKIVNASPERKKYLILRKFFKMKRNQQVEVYSEGKDVSVTLGKVTAIGRDFVMLTNLKDRIWFPYHAIKSANLPYGIPTYSNSHQYYLYDNDLRRKLLTDFGKTVSKRETLIQQFYEETFQTNLCSWKGTWVKVKTDNSIWIGKIQKIESSKLLVRSLKENVKIELEEILYVQSVRVLSFLSLFTKKFRGK